MSGGDLWWHLASGRWIWRTRTLSFVDPWSFTSQGRPWLNHEWLSDVVFHAWSAVLGAPSLVWWKWLVLATTFGLLFGVLRKIGRSSGLAYLGTLFAVAEGAPFFDIRPHLYSLLLFVLLLRLTLWAPRLPLVLPGVFWIWANMHGGFLFGLVVVAVVVAVRARLEEPRRALPVRDGLIVLACALVCLASPGQWRTFSLPIEYALHGPTFERLREWLPLWEAGIRCPLFYPSILLFVASVVGNWTARAQRKGEGAVWIATAVTLLTFVSALRSCRFIPMFSISLSIVAVAAIRDLLKETVAGIFNARWSVALPALACFLGALVLRAHPLSSAAFALLTEEASFPSQAVNFAEQAKLTGKVFNYYNWGGYLDLRTDGALRVFIDGRADTVFSRATFQQYMDVLTNAPGWEQTIAESGADFVLWPSTKAGRLASLVKSGGWRVLHEDAVGTLLARASGTPDAP